MGLLDNAPPIVHKALSMFILLSIFGIFVAMTVCPSKSAVLGPLGPDGQPEANAFINTGDTAWVLASAALVLLQTPGVAFFYGGMMDSKNIVATMMQSVITMGIIPILWSFLGFSLAFGEDLDGRGVIGDPKTHGLMYDVGATPNPLAPSIPGTLFFIFQCVFAVITPSLIVGAIANRVNFPALCLFICLWHFLVYCPMAHMTWTPDGLLRKYHIPDFAGGTVVHMSSGWAALVAALYLGPRKKTAADLDEEAGRKLAGVTATHGHGRRRHANVTYVLLGAALLWFGWFGFNVGSVFGAGYLAGQTILTTNTAAACSMITWLLLDNSIRGTPMGPVGMAIGAIIGLVVITPAAGFVSVGGAALMAMVGCFVAFLSQIAMDIWGSKFVDDTLDVFVCHGVSGTMGMLLTALFTTKTVNPAGEDGGFYGNGELFGKTIWVCIVLIAWFCAFTLACLVITDFFIRLRCTDEEEEAGLDVSKHGGALHIPEPVKPSVEAGLSPTRVVAESA